MKFTNTVAIRTSKQRVFNYLAQPENIPAWNYAIRQTRKISAGPVGVGSEFVQLRELPRVSEEQFRVVGFHSPSTIVFEGDFGPLKGTLSYDIHDDASGGVLLENTADLHAPGALSVLDGALGVSIKHAVAKNLQVLKRILEA